MLPPALELASLVRISCRTPSTLSYHNPDNQIHKRSSCVRYTTTQIRLFNFTYRYNRRLARVFDNTDIDQDIDQVDLSAFVPTGNNFNLVGRWNSDFTNNRELETFAGFEYNNCC